MKSKKVFLVIVLCCAVFAGGFYFLQSSVSKGYKDYTIQKEQFYVEYSDEYDYGEVLTVEYPRIEGINEEQQELFNQLMYDTAMDRVTYWHFNPSDEVKAFQEENFSIFCSDVNCDVTYHSQYLVSVDYQEYYSAGNPVWMTNGTERSLMLDLETGENYKLTDIFQINEEFVAMWYQMFQDKQQMVDADQESLDILLSLFLQDNEEESVDYFFHPFFYLNEEKDFVIGVTMDPKLDKAVTYEPLNRSLSVLISMEALEPYKKDNVFWEKYEKSEQTGEVLPCADKKKNIWLGEGASIWDYKYY